MSLVRDRVVNQQGELLYIRSYPERDRVLRENQELQKADSVRATDGLRPFARVPMFEYERLAAKYPGKYGDLVSPDTEIRNRAERKLLNSSEGKKYRVGGTSRKSFYIRNNPLAKG